MSHLLNHLSVAPVMLDCEGLPSRKITNLNADEIVLPRLYTIWSSGLRAEKNIVMVAGSRIVSMTHERSVLPLFQLFTPPHRDRTESDTYKNITILYVNMKIIK